MRLTEKNNTGYLTSQKYFPSKEFENKNELESAALLLNKLGQLEDIEEELGIDLITLFKALKNGVWVKNKYTNEIEFGTFTHFSFNDLIVPDTPYMDAIDIKDYGKTWSLTKEELL